MKPCICCKELKPIEDYYKHPRMEDKHLNKCKECCKNQAHERHVFLINTSPEFAENEKERGRLKYHRLNYKENPINVEVRKRANKNYELRYPEKKRIHSLSGKLKKRPGYNLHHWSYNIRDAKDVIELTINQHYLIHRFIVYDTTTKYFISNKGQLLDNKEKHMDFINRIIEWHNPAHIKVHDIN